MEGLDLAYWLADKICSGNDYCKQSSDVLRKQADEIAQLRRELEGYKLNGERNYRLWEDERKRAQGWEIRCNEEHEFLLEALKRADLNERALENFKRMSVQMVRNTIAQRQPGYIADQYAESYAVEMTDYFRKLAQEQK